MNDELRPSTGNARATKRPNTPAFDDQPVRNPSKDSSKFKERFEVIRSARQRKPLPEPPLLTHQQPLQSSRSKFLQKYDSIRGLRQSVESEGAVQETPKGELEGNRKAILQEDKLSTLSSHDSLLDSHDPPAKKTVLKPEAKNHQRHSDPQLSRPTSAGVEFVSLMSVETDSLLVKTEEGGEQGKQGEKEGKRGVLTGYWKTENKFVSLIPLERNEKVSFQHPHLLPIYAEVALQGRRYVISDEYKQCSLRNLLEEFGPFGQELGRRYLRQIAVGLQHMHYHRRPHNRLCSSAILYNRDGQLLLNALPATSFPPSREEIAATRFLHTFAPEFLLAKGFSRSLKNDVWALGCLAILMLTPTGLIRSPLHPYNKTTLASEQESQMVDNLRQLHSAAFKDPSEERLYRNPARVEPLSEAAINFIAACLQPLAEQRPSIEVLLEHQFFQGG